MSSSQQAQVEGALVDLGHFQHTGLTSYPEVRFERDRVERYEPVRDLPDLAGGAEDADVGPAVADDVKVVEPAA